MASKQKPERAHLPDGVYAMECVDGEITRRYNKNVVHLVWFEPVTGQYLDHWLDDRTLVPAATVANGGKPYEQTECTVDSLHDLFAHKTFAVRVSETRYDRFGNQLQPGEGYTVIREVVRRLADEQEKRMKHAAPLCVPFDAGTLDAGTQAGKWVN